MSVVSSSSSPIDQFLEGIKDIQKTQTITIDACTELLKSEQFKGRIGEGTPQEQLSLVIRKGVRGPAKEAAHAVADAVYDSPLFAMGTEDQQRVIAENTSWAAKKWAAFSGWMVRWAKTIANKFCHVTGITALVVKRKLVKYTASAMTETLKTIASGQIAPSTIAVNFAVNFGKAIKNDGDVTGVANRFLEYFLKKVIEKTPDIQKRWAEAQEKPSPQPPDSPA